MQHGANSCPQVTADPGHFDHMTRNGFKMILQQAEDNRFDPELVSCRFFSWISISSHDLSDWVFGGLKYWYAPGASTTKVAPHQPLCLRDIQILSEGKVFIWRSCDRWGEQTASLLADCTQAGQLLPVLVLLFAVWRWRKLWGAGRHKLTEENVKAQGSCPPAASPPTSTTLKVCQSHLKVM